MEEGGWVGEGLALGLEFKGQGLAQGFRGKRTLAAKRRKGAKAEDERQPATLAFLQNLDVFLVQLFY